MLLLKLQYLDVLLEEFAFLRLSVIHVPCWCSLEYWNMSKKTMCRCWPSCCNILMILMIIWETVSVFCWHSLICWDMCKKTGVDVSACARTSMWCFWESTSLRCCTCSLEMLYIRLEQVCETLCRFWHLSCNILM
jgi:hypothetical protein